MSSICVKLKWQPPGHMTYISDMVSFFIYVVEILILQPCDIYICHLKFSFFAFHKPMSTLFGIWNLRFSIFIPRKPRDNYIWHLKFSFYNISDLEKLPSLFIFRLMKRSFFFSCIKKSCRFEKFCRIFLGKWKMPWHGKG